MAQPQGHSSADERFKQLQDLLFVEDGQLTDHFQAEVNDLRKELRDPKEIAERVQPLVDQKIEYLREHFPELFGHVMAQTIKKQIQESQDEMIDALYPIIGKLIRKFLAKELERLVERVDESINDAFSWKTWRRRIVGWFKGESAGDQMIRDIARAEVEEVFLVDKDSGLLAGSWSRNEMADQDMVAGMLTAIKSFVESAFQGGAQDLETIEYETYKILLHNFHTYYVAVIVSGVASAEYKSHLSDFVMALEERHNPETRVDITNEVVHKNSEMLKAYFNEFRIENQ